MRLFGILHCKRSFRSCRCLWVCSWLLSTFWLKAFHYWSNKGKTLLKNSFWKWLFLEKFLCFLCFFCFLCWIFLCIIFIKLIFSNVLNYIFNNKKIRKFNFMIILRAACWLLINSVFILMQKISFDSLRTNLY